jgi:hypothetical protein
MILNMKQVLLEIDEALAADLERAVPARSRRRSEFIRQAIRRALWDHDEAATAEAYRRQPDTEAVLTVDPALWDASGWRKRGGRKR